MSDVPERLTASPSEVQQDSERVLLVRLLPGQVGESRRVVHVVPFPDTLYPTVLVARCGEEFYPDTAEFLPEMGGMPCERCVLATPTPADE